MLVGTVKPAPADVGLNQTIKVKPSLDVKKYYSLPSNVKSYHTHNSHHSPAFVFMCSHNT